MDAIVLDNIQSVNWDYDYDYDYDYEILHSLAIMLHQIFVKSGSCNCE